ncbi:MAG: glycosyltransferase family protein [Phormidium sp. BM_Day4_Bin.17]|nr:glycosyltransferase family protein [Phormidium sp. BM_Day4_Bin.17]UCJ12925.1 MAG: tetratricopeptide repeat-containing glycosyltransferase family protein [Phormidium sp. PBR-2020]
MMEFETALGCYEAREYDRAIAICETLLAQQPQRLDVLNLLGGIAFKRQEWSRAIAYYQTLLRHHPRCATGYANLGRTWQQIERLEEAQLAYRQALVLHHEASQWWFNLGYIYWDLGQLDEAIACFETVLGLVPDWHEARSTLSLIRLLQGDFQRGFADYEARPSRRDLADNFPRGDLIWQGEPLPGKTLLLLAEQGFGDAIQFVRYVPQLAAEGVRVWLRCRPPLLRLFQGVPGCDRLFSTEDPIPPWDAHALLMSLPYLRQTPPSRLPAQVPYLYLSPHCRPSLPAPKRGGVKVGLVWSGSPTHRKDGDRSCSLAAVQTWFDCPNIQFYSLQTPVRPEEQAALAADERIIDLAPQIRDFWDTAALMQDLDLVISVDTAVIHLAGALGKPAWVLLAKIPDWRWGLEGDRSPWYPSVRLFRQSRRGEWQDVLLAVGEQLRRWDA